MGDGDNRLAEHGASSTFLKIGDLTIDLGQQAVYRGAERIRLAPKPFEVLAVLIQNSGRIVSKDELLANVWGESYKDKNTVEQAVRQIRLALGDDADHPRFIQTFPRQGYRFLAPEKVAAPVPGRRIQPTPRHYFYLAMSLALIVGAGAVWSRSAKFTHLPASVVFSSNSFQARGSDGRVLWTHTFPATLDPGPVDGGTELGRLERLARITDLLGDGGSEVLLVAPLRLGPNTQNSVRIEIDCFSSKGKLLWSYTPDDVFKFGEDEFGGPWYLFDIMVSRRRAKNSIYAAFNHREWGNSFVEEIDPATGRGIVRFVNSGTTRTLDELVTPHATYLLVGGFNNEHEGGSLAVIEEDKPFAASPQTPGGRYECRSCPAGVPDWYFVFPRSEINALRKVDENPIIKQDVTGTRFELWKSELVTDRGSRGAQTFYGFEAEPFIHPISLRYSSTYDTFHREAEKNGELDHSLAACPERLRPAPIRVWTQSAGWKELAIKPVP